MQRKGFLVFELIIDFIKDFFQDDLGSFRSKLFLEKLTADIKHNWQLLRLLSWNSDLYSIWNSMGLFPDLVNNTFELLIRFFSDFVCLDYQGIELGIFVQDGSRFEEIYDLWFKWIKVDKGEPL